MNELEISAEDGLPSTSYKNVCSMAIIHGTPVAITHIVIPRDEHITKIFFFDGKSHTALGLAIGYTEEMSDDRYAKVHAMRMVIGKIDGMNIDFDSRYLLALGHGEEIEKSYKANRNVVYHFMAPDKATLAMVRDSDGMMAFDQSSEFLKEDENDIYIITESPDNES